MWRQLKISLIASGCILFLASVCSACPTCKEAITEGADHEQVIRGYFWSIIFMMSMPFLILSGLGTYFYLLVRSARTSAASASTVAATNVPA